MDVSFTLWSLKEVLAKIPFDDPANSDPVDLDFSEIIAPYYVKNDFKVSFIYEESLPYEASCSIYSPKNKTTVVIIMKREYEDYFRAWQGGDKQGIEQCCFRRELYCHEACHLVGIIRAYPSVRTSKAREDFITKIKEKFTKSVKTAEEIKPAPLAASTEEKSGESPSVFDKDHFRYGDDSLNYFDLYKELMFPYDRMISTIELIAKKYNGAIENITFEDVEEVAFVSQNFFNIFPEKLVAFRELLAEKVIKKKI